MLTKNVAVYVNIRHVINGIYGTRLIDQLRMRT